jgi:hypothetical protein
MVTAIRPASNGAEQEIEYLVPYRVQVSIEGVAPLLFHGWNNEAVEEKSKARKNSKAKKTDNLESYVYRCDNGNLGIRGDAFRAALVEAGRYMQDPRSPRKSARDLLKAAIIPLTLVADTGCKKWDYVDRQRVVVQRSAITRERPALRVGWRATFELLINLPEYVPPSLVNELAAQAGRLCGLYDFRPTYGRFQVTHFEVLKD